MRSGKATSDLTIIIVQLTPAAWRERTHTKYNYAFDGIFNVILSILRKTRTHLSAAVANKQIKNFSKEKRESQIHDL